MKSSIISTIQHLKIAIEYCQDIQRNKGSRAAEQFKAYENRIRWIIRDFATNPLFTDQIRDGLRKELQTDPFVLEAIRQKLSLIPSDYRLDFEESIDAILEGKKVKIIIDDK